MPDSLTRRRLHDALEAHLEELGFTSVMTRSEPPIPEIARLNPLRGRLVYGESVLHSDLRRKECHERLRFFSQRRTRRRTSIPFFIGVAAAHEAALERLLERLDIYGFGRGTHVQIVPLPVADGRKPAARRQKRG